MAENLNNQSQKFDFLKKLHLYQTQIPIQNHISVISKMDCLDFGYFTWNLKAIVAMAVSTWDLSAESWANCKAVP